MNKTLKLTTALGTSMFAMAFAVTVASADTSVVNTGANTDVNTGTTQNVNVDVSNNNSAYINQSSFSVTNTGGNSTDGNIGGASINSGSAAVSNDFEATANQNQTGIALPSSSIGSADVDVVNSGFNLDVDAGNTSNTRASVHNSNNLISTQGSFSLVNSGLNSSSHNVGGADITTGAAGVVNGYSIEANANETVLDLSGLNTGSDQGSLDLVNTGAFTDVNFGDTQNTRITVCNFNNAMVNQGAFSIVNSGLNSTDHNVGGAAVQSGNALASNDFGVMANNNATGINFAGLSGLSGNEAMITNTGFNLDVNNGTTVNTTVTAASSNSSMVAQTSVDVSNSGLNFASSNVGGGNADSGDAGVWSGFMSGVNWNQTLID